MRIVVLGGRFGGVATVRHLERVLRRRTNVEMVQEARAAAPRLTSVARD